MISIIVGNKGQGKTKKLISMVDEAVSTSLGNIVVVEKMPNLGSNITTKARLVNTDAYDIKSVNGFYGFLAGICAGNYDVTHIFVDATLKIIGRDYNDLVTLFKRIEGLSKESDADFILTVSEDKDKLPAEIFDLCKLVD
ncbi:MAG: hypothetical protein IKE65_10005 [Clostridia bacterium]|nr:hypothetical protein [Clostridia bacterium]